MASRFEDKTTPALTQYKSPNISEGVFHRGNLQSTGQGMIDFAKGVSDTAQAMQASEMASIKNQGAMMGLGMDALKMVAGKAQQGMKEGQAEAENQISYQVNPQTGEMTAVGPGDGAFAGAANMFSGGGVGEDFLGGFLGGGGNTGGSSSSIFDTPQDTKVATPASGQPAAVSPGAALGMSVVSASPAAFKSRVDSDLFTAANEQFKGDPEGFHAYAQKYTYNISQLSGNKAGQAVAAHAYEYSGQLFRGLLSQRAADILQTGQSDITARLARQQENLGNIARTFPGDDFESKVAETPAYKEIEQLTGSLSDNPAYNKNWSPETRKNYLEQVKQDAINNNVIGRSIAIRDQRGVDEAIKYIDSKTINSTSTASYESKEKARTAAIARVNYYTEQQKATRDASNKAADEVITKYRAGNLAPIPKTELMKYAEQFRKNYAPEAAMAMETLAAVRNGPVKDVTGLPAMKALEAVMGNGPQIAMERGYGWGKGGLENPADAYDKHENFNAAVKDKNMTAQEQYIYNEHLGNVWGDGGVDNADGSRSSLKAQVSGFTDDRGKERYYLIPTVWGGKTHSSEEAVARAKERGLDNYPSDKNEKRLTKRYNDELHPYMEKDTTAYQNYSRYKTNTQVNAAATVTPDKVNNIVSNFTGRHVGESQECVALVKEAYPWVGNTRHWSPGGAVNGNTPIGAPIATFGADGQYKNVRGQSHAAIYLGPGSTPGSIKVLDQWRGHTAGVREIQPGDKAESAQNFQVINGAQGAMSHDPGTAAYPYGGAGRRMFDPSNAGHYLDVTKGIENPTGNPYARSPTGAMGDFQFTHGTWARYALPGMDPNNPAHSREAATRLAIDNYNQLKGSLGRDVSEAEVYLAHQQGAGGAAALLSHPEQNAVQALVNAGVPLRKAEQAIRVNGGTGSMTAGEFTNKWVTRFETGKTVPGGYNGAANAAYVNGGPPPNGVSMTALPTQAPPIAIGANSPIPFTAEQIGANPFLLSESVNQLAADAKRNGEMLKSQLPMMEQLLRSGVEPDDKLVAGAIQYSDSHPELNLGLREKFQAITDASKDAFRLQGKDADQYMNRVMRKAVESPDIYHQTYAEEMQKQFTGAAAMVKTDPFKYAQQAGLTTGRPLAFEAAMTPQIYGEGTTANDVIKTAVEQRRIAGASLANNTGMPAVQMTFPESDIKSLSNMLANVDGATAQTILYSLGSNLQPNEFEHIMTQTDFKQTLSGLAHSPDPAKAVAGYEFMEQAYNAHPLIFDAAFKGEKENMSRFMSDVRFYGPDNAMKMRMAENMAGNQSKVYDDRMKEARKVTADFNTSYVIGKLDLPNTPQADLWSRMMNNTGNGMADSAYGDNSPIAPHETDFASASVLTQAYKDTVERYMAAGNSQNVAEDQAAKYLRFTYAKSQYNEGRVMAYAPELIYKTPAEQAAFGAQVNTFVQKQAMEGGLKLDSMVPFSPMGENSGMVIADVKTAIEARTPNVQPSYMVQVRSGGQLHLLMDKETGQPIRFRFKPDDKNNSVEDSRNAILSQHRNSGTPF